MTAALCVALCVIACLAFGFSSFASAGGKDKGAAFGLGATSGAVINPISYEEEPVTDETMAVAVSFAEVPIIESVALRDISQGIEEIAAEEEAARIAAEKARIAAEKAAIERAENAIAAQIAREGSLVLAPVDFSVGREAFIKEWTVRIDNYLAGFPLAGYGEVFATAAWENGVDPRWSPAISNTESTRGTNCFRWHNAWGWGNSGWSSWEEAINAHVAGLASGYGYTISLRNAAKYCPPTYEAWYRDTLGEMKKI